MNPVEQTKAHLDQIQKIENDIAGLKRQQAANAAELQELELQGDLNDPQVLSHIGVKRDFAGLIPTRIAAAEAKRRSMQEECDEFVNGPLREHVSLEIWQISVRIDNHAREALARIFQAHEIDGFVNRTMYVRQIALLRDVAGPNLVGTPAKYFSERLVKALGDAENLAKTLNV